MAMTLRTSDKAAAQLRMLARQQNISQQAAVLKAIDLAARNSERPDLRALNRLKLEVSSADVLEESRREY